MTRKQVASKLKFRLVRQERKGSFSYDKRGKIRVYVRLINDEDSSVVKGNLSRTFTLLGATVSEVGDAIDKLLSV